MRGITYDEDDKIIMNKNLYYCEFGNCNKIIVLVFFY